MANYNKNNIHEHARQGFANGINICRKAVEGTIGGRGINAIIEKDIYPFYIQTKDAFSIIESIRCQEPMEKMAVFMMKDATDSMNKKSKDGRTSMCILTDEIVSRSIASGRSGLEIEDELLSTLPEIEQHIKSQTKEITVDEVEGVATTASDSKRLGKLIASIYKKAGKDCIINHIEASGTTEDYVHFTEGVRFRDTGFLSESMVHDEQAKKAGRREVQAVYYDPKILITKRKINTEEELGPIVELMLKNGMKDLIIFTDDMDSNVATSVINTHKAGIMNICIIKAPIIWKNLIFDDFAKVTGATIVEDATGVNFDNFALEYLGTCKKIIIDKEDTIITPSVDYSEHIEYLKAQNDEESKLRLWWLSTKTATIRLGATNEGELSLMRLKCQDAIHSSQLALENGTVPGGGIALYNVSKEIKNPILKDALQGPLKQILLNAGINQIPEDIGGFRGINVKTKKTVVMTKEGIVDSAMVVTNAIRNAIAIAIRVLTSKIFIQIPEKTPMDLQMEILSKQRTPFQ